MKAFLCVTHYALHVCFGITLFGVRFVCVSKLQWNDSFGLLTNDTREIVKTHFTAPQWYFICSTIVCFLYSTCTSVREHILQTGSSHSASIYNTYIHTHTHTVSPPAKMSISVCYFISKFIMVPNWIINLYLHCFSKTGKEKKKCKMKSKTKKGRTAYGPF